MPNRKILLAVALRGLGLALLTGMAACQSLGSGAEQRAFVAAHIVKSPASPVEGPIYLARDGAFAQRDDEGTTQIAQADVR